MFPSMHVTNLLNETASGESLHLNSASYQQSALGDRYGIFGWKQIATRQTRMYAFLIKCSVRLLFLRNPLLYSVEKHDSKKHDSNHICETGSFNQ